MTPADGAGMATTALSVSISSSVWSAVTLSPTLTDRLITVPCLTPSETSGTRIS